jgi:hypothetical protein
MHTGRISAMMQDRESLLGQLLELRSEHRDLDTVINRMTNETTFIDQLYLQRLKKRKLLLKDRITRVESQLIPDNIA